MCKIWTPMSLKKCFNIQNLLEIQYNKIIKGANKLRIFYLLTDLISMMESESHDILEPRTEPPVESINTIMII